MTACASGCTIRGEHTTACDHATCRGCLPRPIDDPRTICDRCEGALRHDLVAAPDLVAHLRTLLEPAVGEPIEHLGKTAKHPTPPAPLNVSAVAAADDLHAQLASWVLLVIDERRVSGPSWVGSIVRPGTKRKTAGEVVYEDPRVIGVRDPASTARLVRWLLPHTQWVAEQPWAADMVGEVTRLVRTLTARWPTEERPTYLPVPCPACGCETLVRTAPRWEGAPVMISCYLVGCGHVVPEDRYAWLTRLALGMRGGAA